VSTSEAFKQTIIKAQSIATIPESAAGAYILQVFGRLGIAEAVKPKIKTQATTGAIPQAVAKGEAELGIFLSNVLIAPGVELAGPFPAELQNELVFTAAVAADSKEAAAAKAFIDYLKTPEATAVMKAKGVTPG
jgi:molybdate transport system substrate-binding protein